MAEMSKKQALLEATAQLIWEKGFDATSPKDIQNLAGAGQGSFYHHFDSKEDLVHESLKMTSAALCENISHSFTTKPAPVALHHFIHKQRQSTQGCKIGRMVADSAVHNDKLMQPVRAFFSETNDHLSRALEDAPETSPFPGLSPEEASLLLMAIIQGGYILGRAFKDDDMHQKLADILTRIQNHHSQDNQ